MHRVFARKWFSTRFDNTRSCAASTTPQYITALGGIASHWKTSGATSVYQSTSTGFGVYVNYRNGTITPAQANTWQWHLNWRIASEKVVTKYYYFNNQRIAMKQNGVISYLHSDHLGSTVAVTGAGGGLFEDQKYYAYGNQRDSGPVVTAGARPITASPARSMNGCPLGAACTITTPATTDHEVGAKRHPSIGAFIRVPLGRDTIVPDPALVSDYNRYLYVRGNPLKYNDPSGHCPICLAPVLIGMALMVSADSPLPPEEAAKTEASGQIGASLVAGDVNDVVTVASGYDYITDQPVPYFSEEWYKSVGMAMLPVVSASTLRAASKTFEVAFGFTRNLGAFKRVVPNAQNYMDLGLDPYADDFADNLLGAMHDADHIHFDISNMLELTGKDGVLTGAVQFPRGTTNWELRTIWDDPALIAKTTFYRYGEEISPEEILLLQD